MEYSTVEQVAERLQVSAWTVRRWLREGKLEGSYLSDRAGWRVSEEAIAQFLQERSNRAGEASGGGDEGKAAAWSSTHAAFMAPNLLKQVRTPQG